MKSVEWWEIIVGIALIFVGIFLFFFYKKSKLEVNEYKKLQLNEYKKNNPKFRGTYEESKLILPWSQRLKLCMWPLISICLIIIGISFSTGMMFSFFIR